MKSFLPLLLAAFVAGCASAPPRQPIPSAGVTPPQAYAAVPEEVGAADDWLAQFADPALEAYAAQVLADNLDLRIAAARLETARLSTVLVVGQELPDLSASASAGRARTVSSVGTVATGNTFTLGLNLAWEADLWGRLRNNSAAALADYQAAQAEWYGARLSLAATAAQAWFSAITAREQVALAERALRTYEDAARLIRSRYESGTSSALDLRLTLANVASAAARLEQRREQYQAAQRTLEVLATRYPAGASPLDAALPQLVAPIPAGLPSDLLARRPDLVAAERAYAASQQRAARARKDMLPALRLTAGAGRSSRELGDLLDGSTVWNFVGGLTQPLLNGGELRTRAAIARTEAERSGHAYALNVLQAFRDVEQALAAEDYLGTREAHLREAVTQSIAAENLSWDGYTAGLTDIIAVLEAQRRSITAQTELLDVRNARLQNRVNLHVALGGGFDSTILDAEPDAGTPVGELIGP